MFHKFAAVKDFFSEVTKAIVSATTVVNWIVSSLLIAENKLVFCVFMIVFFKVFKFDLSLSFDKTKIGYNIVLCNTK